MLVSGLWKLAAMTGVVGVGLVAVYQAHQGMDTAAAVADPGNGVEVAEVAQAEIPADPVEEPPRESPAAESNPFDALDLNRPKPPKRETPAPKQSQTAKTDWGADSANEQTTTNPTAKPNSVVTAKRGAAIPKPRSGPGVDFRKDALDTETETPKQPQREKDGPNIIQVQGTDTDQNQPARLPDDLDALEAEVLKSSEKTRKSASTKSGMQPFVRQSSNTPKPLDEPVETSLELRESDSGDPGTSELKSDPDPFDSAPAGDPIDSKPDSFDQNSPKERNDGTPAGDPFGEDPPPLKTPSKPTPSRMPELLDEPPPKSVPKAIPEPDPFDTTPEPIKTRHRPSNGPSLGVPTETKEVPADSFPGFDDPNGQSTKELGPESTRSNDIPTRRNPPKLPTEVPDPFDSNPAPEPRPVRTVPDPLDISEPPPAREVPLPSTNRGPVSIPMDVPDPMDPAPGSRNREPANRRSTPLDDGANDPGNDLLGDGTIAPGTPRGIQQPRITVEKIAPKQASLGEPLVYSVIIKNIGTCDAHQVLVEDRIPKGTELTGTAPRAEMIDKKLVSRIGTLKAKEERKISIRVIPRQQGSIGSVANVSFVTEVAAEIVVAAPQLAFTANAPRQARVGETFEMTFLLKNTSNVPANNVSVRDLVPDGLKHEAASDIECPIGKLAPGESREIVLAVTAVKPGRAKNRAIMTADGGLTQELETAIEVVGELLSLTRTGQNKIYVDRPATFTNNIKNDGNTDVKRLRIAEIVPAGMEFVEASDGGRFDPAQRAIFWDLATLPAGAEATVSSKLIARAPGLLQAKITATGPAGSTAALKTEVDAVGRPELQIETVSRTGQIAVGDRLTSKIQLKNHGSAAAKNVAFSIRLPKELKLVEVRGAQYSQRDNAITFDPVATIGPKESAAFEIVMEAISEADAQINLEIAADHLTKPARRSETVQIATEVR